MDRDSISVKLVDGGKGCSFALRNGDGLLGSLTLEASAVDELLHNLSMQRAAMEKQVPRKLAKDSRTTVASQPEWTVPEDPAPNARVLLLRHSGFGWLAFHMTTERAMNMAAELGRESSTN